MKVKGLGIVVLVIVVVIVCIIGAGVIGIGLYNKASTPQNDLFATKTTVLTSDMVIDKIEQVSELTTTKYTIQLVAKSETVGEWYSLGTQNVKMLLIAKGTVRAGLDLEKLDASDVSVSDDGKSVTVHLPQVKIFDRDHILSSNPSDTYVYDIQKGIAADTTNTETQLRGLANDQILEAACKEGIMDEATKNAEIVIKELLNTFVDNVFVIGASVPSVDDCKAK